VAYPDGVGLGVAGGDSDGVLFGDPGKVAGVPVSWDEAAVGAQDA
jgi:hypothetical protein